MIFKKINIKKILGLINYVTVPAELKKKYIEQKNSSFLVFFRYGVALGLIVHLFLIPWDYFQIKTLDSHIIYSRAAMVLFLGASLLISCIPKFKNISQYYGVACILTLMINIIFTQSLLENTLEKGYGMLVTPGTNLSMIVFSGSEVGYGALLTPLLVLPIAFTGAQAFFVSLITLIFVNYGLSQTELPSSFVQTVNSVFLGICVFTTILAYLVNQKRRKNFLLEYHLTEALENTKQENKAKSDLLATLSHEVRNFITGIIGISSDLEKNIHDREQKELISNFGYSGEALLALINDILDFSKIESGELSLDITDTDIRKLATTVVELINSRALEKDLNILIDIDESVPNKIYTDPTKLRQVLMNLTSNAIKFTDQGFVKLIIKATKNEGKKATIYWEVKDTGIGISDEAQANLFKKYKQADVTTSRKYGGTGLGLNICQSIIQAMGGEIIIDSKLNHGSSFIFEIEVDVEQEDENLGANNKCIPVVIKPLSVLLVEDDKIISKHTTNILKIQNHRVTTAYNGKEAIESLENNNYDIILMDYNMPVMNGIETTKIIRSLEGNKKNIPIVFLSATTNDENIQLFHDAGGNDHLLKPLDEEELFKKLAGYSRLVEVKSKNYSGQMKKMSKVVDMFGEDYVVGMINEFNQGIENKIKLLEIAIGNNAKDVIILNAHDIASMSGTIGLEKTCNIFKKIETQEDEFDDIASLFVKAKEIFIEEKEELRD